MTKAEQAAKEIYKDGIQLVGRRDKNNNLVIYPETMVGILRSAAERGYEQAEKDLGWISVKDRLPKENGYYITCIEDFEIAQSVGLTLFSEGKWRDDDNYDREEIVEYWMPIPKLPKK